MAKGSLFCVMVVLIVCLLGFGGCDSAAGTGGAIGTGIGALAGQAIGGDTKSTLLGAAVGGGAGYVIGDQQDKKKAEAQRRAEMNSLRQEMNMVFVNITNSNKSISQVGLRKQGIGYVGPNGEYYNYLPTAAELEPIYAF